MISLCNKLSDLQNESWDGGAGGNKWETERQGCWRNGNQASRRWKERCAVELFALPKSSPLRSSPCSKTLLQSIKMRNTSHLCPITNWHTLCLSHNRCLLCSFLSLHFWFHDIIIGIIWTERRNKFALWFIMALCQSKLMFFQMIQTARYIGRVLYFKYYGPPYSSPVWVSFPFCSSCSFIVRAGKQRASSRFQAVHFKKKKKNMMHIDLIACIMGFFFLE